ncbi:MAG: fluoride efflux transporter CrcB [Bacteroidota bacterium]
MNFLAVFIGGGLGSLARYLMGILVSKSNQSGFAFYFPLATFLSNVLACIILAFTIYFFKDKFESSSWISPLIITGFCGGFSTFSSFSLETTILFQQGNYLWAILNIVISLAFGVGIFLFFQK